MVISCTENDDRKPNSINLSMIYNVQRDSYTVQQLIKHDFAYRSMIPENHHSQQDENVSDADGHYTDH